MMKKMQLFLFCLLTVVVSITAADSLTSQVDVFVGTQGDHGQLHPGAAVPFGLVMLGPDTDPFQHTGYDYTATRVKGFSHTRVGGVGCSGAGETLRISPSLDNDPADKLVKSTETGAPGYYGVTLASGIKVELTAAEHVGYHRYVFPADAQQCQIKISPEKSLANMINCSVKVNSDSLVTGTIRAGNVCGHGYNILHYAVKFSVPMSTNRPDGKALWCDMAKTAGQELVVELKVGLSPISIEQAIEETEAEISGWDFKAAYTQADAKWAKMLGRVELGEVPAEMQEFADLFYTSLYRSYQYPFNVTSSRGQYRVAGDEDTVRDTAGVAPDYVHYAGWSSWDDFRKYSLISLLEPEVSHNIARSIVEWFGVDKLCQWGSGYWPAPTVRHEFIGAIVADAYFKGLRDYDAEVAYKGLKASILGNDQLEKPYQYYLVMKMAKALGKLADVSEYRSKALGYRDYWCSRQVDGQGNIRGFFTADGKAVPQDRVDVTNAVFYQGNLWHYRYWVPHDIAGLVNLRGSRTALADELDYYFLNYEHIPHNQPPLAYPFLFDFLGRPWRTQYWSRHFLTDTVTVIHESRGDFREPQVTRVMKKSPDGYMFTMDDDAGSMASNYVFTALGLFPSCVGDPYYTISSPLFPQAKLNLANGKTFEIVAKNTSIENKYIKSVTLNGEPYNKPWISYAEIFKGGKLEFEMSPAPNFNWGTDEESAPPSLSR